MSKRICVIGAGYVGMQIAADWRQRGAHVTVTTTTPSRVEELQAVADEVYCLKESGLRPWCEKIATCDAVMVTVAPKITSLEAYRTCYLGLLQQVLECMAHAKTPPHLFYTSSTSVYGEWHGADVSETDQPSLSSLSPYARILYQAEELLLHAMKDSTQRVTILRLGEILGPHRNPLKRIQEAGGRPFPGNGTRFVNVSHVRAIVQAVAFCDATQVFGLYNLCSVFHPTREIWYQVLAEREGLPPPTWDGHLTTFHQGNKKVLSTKIARTGFCYPEDSYYLEESL